MFSTLWSSIFVLTKAFQNILFDHVLEGEGHRGLRLRPRPSTAHHTASYKTFKTFKVLIVLWNFTLFVWRFCKLFFYFSSNNNELMNLKVFLLQSLHFLFIWFSNFYNIRFPHIFWSFFCCTPVICLHLLPQKYHTLLVEVDQNSDETNKYKRSISWKKMVAKGAYSIVFSTITEICIYSISTF